jgi:hypothetical protein
MLTKDYVRIYALHRYIISEVFNNTINLNKKHKKRVEVACYWFVKEKLRFDITEGKRLFSRFPSVISLQFE